jgi:hypothetical protein
MTEFLSGFSCCAVGALVWTWFERYASTGERREMAIKRLIDADRAPHCR